VKKVIAILIITAFSLSGCNQVPDKTSNEIEEKNAVIAELERRIDILEYELYVRRNIDEDREWQEEKTDQELQLEEFQKWQAEFHQMLRTDLMSRSDLIPFEWVSGGAPGFRYENNIHFEMNYALAYADNGHFAAITVLTYVLEEDETITWELAAYDLFDGLGLRLAD
jgi:hypothetical protein